LTRPAAFLDRDGTIVTDTGFLRDPDTVALIPGAAAAIARLRAAGLPVVVVTNQSGIARDVVTWDEYHAVAAEIDTLLAEAGTAIDATYVCPHHPDVTGPCECRKPGPAHYLAAAARLDLDLAASLFVGDRLSDVEPALRFGGTGILVETGLGAGQVAAIRGRGLRSAPDLAAAVEWFLASRPPR
jgi:D-glycero-D-manno-heptose 1,7-bisphosphate phosphatase